MSTPCCGGSEPLIALWIVLTVMVAVAAAGLAVPLVRRYDGAASGDDAVLGVLRDQLAELDAQVASGVVASSEAEGLRTELKRRVLAESRAAGTQAGSPLTSRRPKTPFRLALGSGVIVALAATGLYAVRGRPDLTTPAPVAMPADVTANTAAAPAAGAGLPPQIAAMLSRLEARLAQSPRDPDGWQLLGASYFQLGRYDDAAKAYAKAAALTPAAPNLQSALGEALVQAAGGVVTPSAQAAFAAAHARDPADARARYFLAMLKDQRGDRKGALTDWVQLLRDAPPSAPWAAELRKFAATAAAEQGLDLTTLLAARSPQPPTQ